jgi:hypothetical protein
MQLKIAVATVSGKAYYWLVNELKRRKTHFLSLMPNNPIPASIQVVITTEEEKPMVKHPTVLIYSPESDPSAVINEAIRIVQSKEAYKQVTIGVDPGKNFGIAVLGDGKVLKKEQRLPMAMAINTVLTELKNHPAQTQKVKIGNGMPQLAEEVIARLNIALPETVAVEIVSEGGTSTLRGEGSRRKISDADSAVEIAKKNGTPRQRRKDY